ncbi:MAG: hypothetical protein IJR44_06025 [Neisseriaceae bacterium]|nr:hypothetical protein [Neisseriaceae bacterium]
MKKIYIMMLVATLTACATVSPNEEAKEEKIIPTIQTVYQLPETIRLNNQTFYKRFDGVDTAEYYLSQQQENQWQEMVSLRMLGRIDMDAFAKSLKATHEAENAKAKRRFEVKQNGQQIVEKTLFYPIKNDARFNKYEATYALIQPSDCGMLAISYSKNFPRTQKANKLWQDWRKKESWFIKNAPKIACQNQAN